MSVASSSVQTTEFFLTKFTPNMFFGSKYSLKKLFLKSDPQCFDTPKHLFLIKNKKLLNKFWCEKKGVWENLRQFLVEFSVNFN